MRKNIVRIFLAAALAVASWTGSSVAGNSITLTEEKPMAGLTLSLEKYCNAIIADRAREEQEVISQENGNTTDTKSSETTVKSSSATDDEEDDNETSHLKLNLVYDRLGVAKVDNYLNVRRAPGENSKIVGKMTRNSGCNVYTIRKGWAKIVSGKVRGWVKAEYLLTDEEAEAKAKQVATLRATVTTETLNVRTLPSTDSSIYDQIAADEEYTVGKKNITREWLDRYMDKYCSKKTLRSVDLKKMYADVSNWVMLKIDEEKVFVSKDFIKFTYNLNRAVTIKQSSESGSSDSSDGSSSGTGSSIVNYAMQFLGNRYVWGGTSLTNGTDCSGFVMRIYEHFGYSLPRTSRAQAAATRSVSSSDVRVGDLFFYGSGSSVSHVALYIGNGQIIHASNARDGIKISNAYYRQPIKIGRVM